MAVQDDETSLVTAASPVERAHIEFVPGPAPAGREVHGIGGRSTSRARTRPVHGSAVHSSSRSSAAGLGGSPAIRTSSATSLAPLHGPSVGHPAILGGAPGGRHPASDTGLGSVTGAHFRCSPR
jgi:hypothetical protein